MVEKIRTLIVDDEPLARRNLRLLLEKDPQIEIIDECRNGREVVEAVKSFSPDLIFLVRHAFSLSLRHDKLKVVGHSGRS
ncbi:MAG: response regulator [Pyrinomonadaceae bacterium]